MIKEKIMKKQVIILAKPSGAVTIAGDLTAIQRKFYDAFLYIVQETLKEKPDQTWFIAKLADLKEVLSTEERDKNNKYYKQEIRKLRKIDVKYNLLGKDKKIEGEASLLTNLEFITNNITGEIEINFDIPNRVKETILNKNKDSIFARIDLAIKKNLRHRYSLILYDLIKDYENAEIPKMSIEEFRELFGIGNKYTYFADIRKKVLNPAIEELNNNSNVEWSVKYELYKSGSKYTHIKFIKTPKPLPELEKQKAQETKNKNYKQIVEQLMQLVPEEYRKKNVEKLLLQSLPEKGYEYLQKQIEYANKAKPKQYAAYLKKAITEDYAGVENSEVAKELEQIEELNKKYYDANLFIKGKKYRFDKIEKKGTEYIVHCIDLSDPKIAIKKRFLFKNITIEELDKRIQSHLEKNIL